MGNICLPLLLLQNILTEKGEGEEKTDLQRTSDILKQTLQLLFLLWRVIKINVTGLLPRSQKQWNKDKRPGLKKMIFISEATR